MAALDPGVRLVFVVLHHPPLADVQNREDAGSQPAPQRAGIGRLS